jgi:hypothetical protein
MSEKEDDWRKPFIDFIVDQLVPDDKAERERITRRSANYVVIGSDLYRKAASTGILMKCPTIGGSTTLSGDPQRRVWLPRGIHYNMLTPDCIYLTDDYMDYIHCENFGSRQVAVFNLKERTFTDL